MKMWAARQLVLAVMDVEKVRPREGEELVAVAEKKGRRKGGAEPSECFCVTMWCVHELHRKMSARGEA